MVLGEARGSSPEFRRTGERSPGIFPGIPQDAGGGIRRRGQTGGIRDAGGGGIRRKGQTGGIRDAGKISRKFRKAPEGRLEVSQDPGEIRTENRGAAGSETLISLR